MSINLKAIREAAGRLEAIDNLPDAGYDHLEREEYWMPIEIFNLQEQLAESAPKLLDWIERAKGHVELSVLSTYCGNESPCLCPRCEAIALLAELEEHDK